MITWPDSLKKEIARRRAVFFLGSGVSSSAIRLGGERLPSWNEFLKGCLKLIHDPKMIKMVEDLINKGKYLTALQGIYDHSDKGDYRAYLKECFNKNDFNSYPIHEIIFDIDLRIVITTNFDKIYESYCYEHGSDGYTVKNYDDNDLGDAIRSDERIIIKAHGCINKISDIIFTRAQYHKARERYPGFYEILKAIFLTHTCVFIGCGMEDPDILLALEDVKITSSAERPHYFLTLENEMNSICMRELFNTYNIKALEYPSSHEELKCSLLALKDEVIELREINNV